MEDFLKKKKKAELISIISYNDSLQDKVIELLSNCPKKVKVMKNKDFNNKEFINKDTLLIFSNCRLRNCEVRCHSILFTGRCFLASSRFGYNGDIEWVKWGDIHAIGCFFVKDKKLKFPNIKTK